MFIDNDYSADGLIAFLIFLILMVSIAIPVYGYSRKRMKGLAIGCLIQPIACAIAITALFAGILFYEMYSLKQMTKKAMVTVRSTETRTKGDYVLTWYLKSDEECIMAFMTDSLAKEDQKAYTVGFASTKSNGSVKGREYFDIIRLDSTSLGVEDRIVVKFDIKHQKVTATDFDKPAEVVGVDWDQVKTFFGKQ